MKWNFILKPTWGPEEESLAINSYAWASLVAQMVKNLPAMQETQL